MPIYDTQNRLVQLGAEVGKGGEAVIHQVLGRPQQLAKVYTSAPRQGYDQKLAWMLAYPPHDPTAAQGHASIAWPTDLLYDDQQQFVGYLMPYIQKAVPLLEVFNPRLRARTLPGFDLRYLYRTARNVAVTLAAIHAQGYVVGDVNESNILVTPSALVTMIDTDSFQVQRQDGARLVFYPCPVGKPEYTSPELQGRSFQQEVQKPEQDCFGLGVLIFQLLMEGSHPFRAQWLQTGDPPPTEERIRQGFFPHAEPALGPVAVPTNALGLNSLHPKLAYLMRLCFVEGHQQPRQRPAPDLWGQVIAEAEKALVECKQSHFYAGHLDSCPYCQLKQSRRTPPPVAPRVNSYPPTNRPLSRSFNLPSPTPPSKPKVMTSKIFSLPMRTATPSPLAPPRPQPSSVTMQAQRVIQKCPQCNQGNPSDEIYCQTCLHQLTPNRMCGYCNQETPLRGSYCVHCGRQL